MCPLKVLVMSVGPVEKNGSARYLEKIGGKEHTIIVLPKQHSVNAAGYEEQGFQVYIYDEKKYINESFEFFGFKPRNCGGVGRQGIAECVDSMDDNNTLFLQIDDDTSAFHVRRKIIQDGKVVLASKTIRHFQSLVIMANALHEFYLLTGIKVMGKTGASPVSVTDIVFSNRKIYNNFLMYKDDELKYEGFKTLCSDDVMYNFKKNIIDATPFLSTLFWQITFTQSQGDRPDGNAIIYNKDNSWKKSYTVRMFNPVLSTQVIRRETNRILFRESLRYAKIYPPIMLSDRDGKITHKLIIR